MSPTNPEGLTAAVEAHNAACRYTRYQLSREGQRLTLGVSAQRSRRVKRQEFQTEDEAAKFVADDWAAFSAQQLAQHTSTPAQSQPSALLRMTPEELMSLSRAVASALCSAAGTEDHNHLMSLAVRLDEEQRSFRQLGLLPAPPQAG